MTSIADQPAMRSPISGLGVIVMAAGLGKRMKSNHVKVLHQVAGQPMVLYFKVDNWDCVLLDPCLPSGSQGGLVPEYNELNNVVGPIVLTGFAVRLPVVIRVEGRLVGRAQTRRIECHPKLA